MKFAVFVLLLFSCATAAERCPDDEAGWSVSRKPFESTCDWFRGYPNPQKCFFLGSSIDDRCVYTHSALCPNQGRYVASYDQIKQEGVVTITYPGEDGQGIECVDKFKIKPLYE